MGIRTNSRLLRTLPSKLPCTTVTKPWQEGPCHQSSDWEWLGMGGFYPPFYHHPPVITIASWDSNHSQMGGLWHCYTHITTYSTNWWNSEWSILSDTSFAEKKRNKKKHRCTCSEGLFCKPHIFRGFHAKAGHTFRSAKALNSISTALPFPQLDNWASLKRGEILWLWLAQLLKIENCHWNCEFSQYKWWFPILL